MSVEEPLLKDILDILTWSAPAPMSVSLLCDLLAQNKTSNLTGALSLGCALRILQDSCDTEAYAIHRLVREVHRAESALSQNPDWADRSAQRLAVWFEKHRENFNDLALFEANLIHIDAWQQNAQALNLPQQADRLIWLQAYPAWHWGRYNEAKQKLEQAQVLHMQSATSSNNELKAHLLNDLSTLNSKLGNFDKALELNKAALALRLKLFGKTHPDTALTLSNLASVYNVLGNTTEALDLGKQTLEI